MNEIIIGQTHLIVFVMVDSNGDEVTGLSTTFTVQISKNGGAFAASAGTKAEIGSGWYKYTLTATETNTAGPLAVKITGTGADQQNIVYQVVGSEWGATPTYATLGELKTYLGIAEATDDTLLTSLLGRAQTAIESYTGRVFECSNSTTRNFTVYKDTVGATLYFDKDLCSIDANGIVTNADDGSGGTALATSDYITLPRNKTPYYAVKILDSSSEYWQYTADAETGITVTGKWAYSTSPPADIVHATLRLAGYYYKQKDAQVFDVTAVPDAGVITVPQGIPADVKILLNAYIRPEL